MHAWSHIMSVFSPGFFYGYGLQGTMFKHISVLSTRGACHLVFTTELHGNLVVNSDHIIVL